MKKRGYISGFHLVLEAVLERADVTVFDFFGGDASNKLT